MKKYLKKNLAMIIIIGILLVAGSILGIAIYKVANRVEPELIVKDNIVLSYAGSAEEVQIDESVQSIATGAFKGKATIKKSDNGEMKIVPELEICREEIYGGIQAQGNIADFDTVTGPENHFQICQKDAII